MATNRRFLVHVIETNAVTGTVVDVAKDGTFKAGPTLAVWDPSSYLDHRAGLRLIEELSRRTKAVCRNLSPPIDAIALSVPGTVEGNTTVSGSSRLGIHEPAEFTKELRAAGLPPAFVFHDVECLAIGEARHGKHGNSPYLTPHSENFAYVFIDEGVGSCLFIDGKVHRGAGVAGHLGRMVVQPNGTYNSSFSCRGPLEVFASRPWISKNIVTEYLAEKDKRNPAKTEDDIFRAAVAAACGSDWSGLTTSHIADGIRTQDPIVTSVLEDAAQYLSIAINAIITIVNPPLIILGGCMIEALQEFAMSVISISRRHAWAGSWNETTIEIGSMGRLAQVLGAADFLRGLVEHQHPDVSNAHHSSVHL